MTDPNRLELETSREHIAYLVSLFEAYDDFAVVHTLDAQAGRVALLCSPDYLPDIRQLLQHLETQEGIPIRIVD